jgi:hypothetical protein
LRNLIEQAGANAGLIILERGAGRMLDAAALRKESPEQAGGELGAQTEG